MVTKLQEDGTEILVLGSGEWAAAAAMLGTLVGILAAVMVGTWTFASEMGEISGRVYSVEAKMVLMHEDLVDLKHHDHRTNRPTN